MPKPIIYIATFIVGCILGLLCSIIWAASMFKDQDCEEKICEGERKFPEVDSHKLKEKVKYIESKLNDHYYSNPKFRAWGMLPDSVEGLAVHLPEHPPFKGCNTPDDKEGCGETKWGKCGYYSTEYWCMIPLHLLNKYGVESFLELSTKEYLPLKLTHESDLD